MRVAVLSGSDSPSVIRNIEALLEIPGVEIAGIFLDIAHPSTKQRFKNLWRNSKREGSGYFLARLAEMMLAKLERAAARTVDAVEVDQLMHQAFPEESFSLAELASRKGLALLPVWNLNSPEAVTALQSVNADLGVVMGTRILKRSTFNVPRLGSINVHKGKVPEFRGMPPAFWELYERADTCGVTIHFVNDGLDTGDIIRETEIPVHQLDRPDTLRHRLNEVSIALLQDAVRDLASGTARPRKQPPTQHKTRTRPTRKQILELSEQAPHLMPVRPRTVQQLVKTAVYLMFQGLGLPALRRNLRRESRAAILLYHRVDDFSCDPLTTSRRRFAEHLCLLRKHYQVRSTSWLLDRLKSRQPIDPRTVLIHFDDCYASVATGAAPMLVAAGLPAASFISSGFIGNDRKFPHDESKFPLDYENLTAEQVCAFERQGIEVGSHTVTHADLGEASPREAKYEMVQSRADLEQILRKPPSIFSFPYGRPENFSEFCSNVAKETGYEAIFSAYGGFVRKDVDLFAIPRFGVADSHRPLDLLMDLEGLGLESARNFLGNG